MMDAFHAVTEYKFKDHVPKISWSCLDEEY